MAISPVSVVICFNAHSAFDRQVTPGMEVLTSNEVLPVMFQNKFVIVSGAGQIRVATYGFIGGPAVGDRPCVSVVIVLLSFVAAAQYLMAWACEPFPIVDASTAACLPSRVQWPQVHAIRVTHPLFKSNRRVRPR